MVGGPPVIVVGAGPRGLAAAVELFRRGVEVLCVDVDFVVTRKELPALEQRLAELLPRRSPACV